MAKFVTCIRNQRNDGLYPVYIRVYHNGGVQYINTGFLVSARGIRNVYTEDGKKQVEVTDRKVLKECYARIEEYANKVNIIGAVNVMDCKTLVQFLQEKNTGLSFTGYASQYINEMCKHGRENPARNYKLAVSKLKEYMGKENIYFQELTSKAIQAWIDSMAGSARKNSLYPSCVRTIVNAAIRQYNDYDLGIIRIRVNPFARVKLPKEAVPEKRSIDAAIINKVLMLPVKFPDYEGVSRMELARDVSLMIFCLAGINAADLYDMKEPSLSLLDWKLKYNRKKTREKSDTGAYMEITVPERVRPLFEKYKGSKGILFSFSKRFSDSTSFVKTVDKGLKTVCSQLGIEKNITTYTFRHSWATIAQNECGASTEQVAFALNHASAHKITEGYIRKDYSPVDKLNEKVMNVVFNPGTLPG